MYLWKYWRESRIAFGISMLGLAVLAWLIFKGVWQFEHHPRHFSSSDAVQLSKIFMASLYVQLLPFAFLSWIMGSYGVGRDLGESSGSYLLTRPRPRSWFLWRDWGFGFLQLVWVAVVANLLIGYLIHRLSGAGGGPFGGSLALRDMVSPVPLIALAGLNCVAIVLFSGLIFGLTYSSTIAVKHARGVMLGAGIVLGYLILEAVAKHYWSITLPDLLGRVFQTSPVTGEPVGLADRLGVELGLRLVVMMIFPVAAQVILDKAEV